MQLSLKKPIVFFDLETTGVNIAKDRIVEISIFKAFPNQSTESKTWLVNPTIPIPKEAMDIHGITNEKVENAPTFKELAYDIKANMEGCDLAGYNSNKFDIPLLAEEFLRVDVDFDLKKHHAVDVQNIFHKMEQRTLSAAYKFYCSKELENAHSAEADTKATYEILLAQVDKYSELENDIEFLSKFSTRGNRTADMAGFIIYNEHNEECFSFGKYKGQTVVSVLQNNPGYFSWIQQADFPLYTKKILTQIKLREF
ncbi:MAG: exonuclease domain-containing protein [Flavobacteriales bacterium]